MCLIDQVQDTINQSPPHRMIRYLSDDPFMIYIPDDKAGLVCTPKVVPPNMTFYIIDSIIDINNYLRVEDQSGTVWRLHPHTGLLTKSELPSISQQTSNNFWVPFKSGCSVDMKTARSNCPSKALTLDLDVQQFLHSLGPMYNLNEIANLMKKPSKSVYQQPEILYLPTVQSWM